MALRHIHVVVSPTSSIARSMLVVTLSPSLLTRQLLIGWRAPLRRLIPFWRSTSLHTSTLSPERSQTKSCETKSELCFFFYPLSPFFLHTCSVNPFSPSSSSHLFVCERVQQVSIEGGGSNDDPASRQINPWRQCGGSCQDSDHALAKGSFQHISLVERQTLRDKPSVNAPWFFWTAVLMPQLALRPSIACFFKAWPFWPEDGVEENILIGLHWVPL